MNFHQSRKKMKKNNDEWYTNPSSWDKILSYIDKEKILFEPFYGAGHTFDYFKSKGYKIVGDAKLDFFEPKCLTYMKMADVVITNPPFSSKYKIMSRLVENNIPFILVLPLHSINTLSFRKCFNNDMKDVSVIIPKGRLQYIQNGKLKKSPSFESCFVCWKMMKEKLLWL